MAAMRSTSCSASLHRSSWIRTNRRRRRARRAQHLLQRLSGREGKDDHLRGTTPAIQEVTAELDNIRAAWTWAAERRHSSLLRDAASTLTQYCDWQGRYHEGVKLCEQAIDRLLPSDSGSEQETALAVLFSAAGWLYIRLGKYVIRARPLRRVSAFTVRRARVAPGPCGRADPGPGVVGRCDGRLCGRRRTGSPSAGSCRGEWR